MDTAESQEDTLSIQHALKKFNQFARSMVEENAQSLMEADMSEGMALSTKTAIT